jgi:aryl-alcohol dehydrogenase-like predicted oxidoreductase
MRRSIELLRASPIDLMQVHNLLDWQAHLETLRSWRSEGLIRYFGVTHYDASAYTELETVMRSERLDFVQVNYAANDREAERRILPLAADRGLAVIINRPFGGGSLLRDLGAKALPTWSRDIDCGSWAQVLLKFVLGHPAVSCVIPGTGRPEHMRDNVRAGIGLMPDAALRARIAASL